MEKQTELIMNYLEGYMTKPQRTDFEQRIKKDSELKAELEMHQRIDSSMRGRNMITQAEKDWDNPEINMQMQEIYADLKTESGNEDEIRIFVEHGLSESELSLQEIQDIEADLSKQGFDEDIAKIMADLEQTESDADQIKEISDFVKQTPAEENIREIKPPRKRNVSLWAFMAAASVLIVIFSVIYFDKLDNNELYAELKRPINISVLETKGAGNTDKLLVDAVEAYKLKKYLEAEAVIDQQIALKTDSAEVYMIKASILMLQHENYTDAILNFDKAANLSATYKMETDYFKMLCYLKMGDNKKTLELCNKINGKIIYDEACSLILKNIRED